MTLKEKFEEILIAFWTSEWESECEKTADEFAIGFADWVRVCKLKQRPYDFENIKELLEIYKDEKDL
jgi:hypothetical protein